MRLKLLVVASTTALLAATAFAQSGTTDPKAGVGPKGPSDAACRAGKRGKMSKKKFDQACAKMRERKEKTQ